MSKQDQINGGGKEPLKVLKIHLTRQQHALISIAANLKNKKLSQYVLNAATREAMRDTQDMNKIRSEVDSDLQEQN
jgi:uncharacterized protein (DUF1778 family)